MVEGEVAVLQLAGGVLEQVFADTAFALVEVSAVELVAEFACAEAVGGS